MKLEINENERELIYALLNPKSLYEARRFASEDLDMTKASLSLLSKIGGVDESKWEIRFIEQKYLDL